MEKIPLENKLINFFKETLRNTPPVASMELYHDSQTNFIISELQKIKKPIKILDYGCGNLRLLNGIINKPSKLPSIDYFATDIIKPHNNVLKSFNKKTFRFITPNKLRASYMKTFDVIVLMNVIHEISIHNITVIFEDIRRCLKENGMLLLIDMSTLPEGEPLAIPFYSWEFNYILKEYEDKSFKSKNGYPIIALKIPKHGIDYYPNTLEKIYKLLKIKRNTYSEVACSLNQSKSRYDDVIIKLSLSDNNIHNLGLLMLLCGHSNYRISEEKRRPSANYEDITNAAKAILKLFFEIWENEQKLLTPNQIFETLGSKYTYQSLWHALKSISNEITAFFYFLESDGSKSITPTESLDAFVDYFSYKDIGKLGLHGLQLECYKKNWPDYGL